MRITLHIDDETLAAAMEHSDGRSRAEVMNEALRQFAQRKRRKALLNLRGKVR